MRKRDITPCTAPAACQALTWFPFLCVGVTLRGGRPAGPRRGPRVGCGRGARLRHGTSSGAGTCRSDCLTVNLPEARGLSPGQGRPLSESQMSRAPHVSQAQSRDGTSTWASTLHRPAPSPLPCPARGSEDPPLPAELPGWHAPPVPRQGLGLDPSYQGSAGFELDLAPVPCCGRHSPGRGVRACP